MWSAIENTVAVSVSDPTAVLHSHLASALSTLGDAQYWEETISPSEIRTSLQETDPSSPLSTPVLLKCMKWLLASISKGRDVSDFYVLVVKLVACPITEVRKMVYTYLVQYADHNAETRELSLLSINSFQRGLSDPEPLLRALALRVLTSVQLSDILVIQILAVTKHAKADTSPYVRKCAAVAIAKLAPRCCSTDDEKNDQRDILLELVQYLLETDRTTMVLSSALIAFQELTGAETSSLFMLHGCFRKLCHLLTDMDEWGQVVCIEVLTRYCRHFFCEPANYGAAGSAERVDAARRVIRRQTANGTVTTEPLHGIDRSIITDCALSQQGESHENRHTHHPHPHQHPFTKFQDHPNMDESPADRAAAAGVSLPPRNTTTIKQRVIKKSFYSDEDDVSTEEEIFAERLSIANGRPQIAMAMRQGNATLSSGGDEGRVLVNNHLGQNENVPASPFDEEELDLDDDHRFLLRSAMSLLKSRNAGVVLAVCSLQYYCGVSSIPVRKAMGKALVRIHRAKHREIQYVVLTSIRSLVKECPSAFSPFLHDFFVLPDMDPPFTRLIKLDILTSLALDPPSIETVLKELRTYVQLHHNSDEYTDDDTTFVCAAVQAVGRVAEMARIVFARHSGDRGGARCAEADTIALNCLYGLVTFSQAADNEVIVGETVTVMQRILQMLQSDRRLIEDPNQVRDRALQRILLLLVNTLSHVIECDVESHEDEEDSIDVDDVVKLDHVTLILPPIANASAIWLMGECLASLSCCGVMPLGGFDSEGRAKLRMELIRLLVRSFVDLDVPEKEQAIHFASKILLSKDGTNNQEVPLCEQLLAMGRLDADPDVRDRARFESGVIHLFLGLLHDSDGLDSIPMALQNTKRLNLEDAKHIFLSRKPSPSYLPLECPNINQAFGLPTNGTDRDREGTFRFGTLSSLVGHRARSAYLQLPTWAKKNSLSSLRDPPEDKKDDTTAGERQDSNQGSFYESSGDDDSSSSESASTSSSTSNSASDTSSSDSEISEEPKRVEQRTGGVIISTANVSQRIRPGNPHDTFSALQAPNQVDNNTDESSSSESDDGDSSDESFNSNSDPMLSSGFGTLLPTGTTGKRVDSIGQSVADDMKDLVFAPAVLSSAAPPDVSLERDSGEWVVFIRSEHSSGLSMEGRYLRGETKAKQAQAMGLAAEKPTIVCLQVRFENKKAIGATSIRHIRIIQRSSSTSSSTIGPRNIVLPLEISELPCGRKVECMIGIDFSGVSDREGSLLAKLEVKFGSTGASVDLKPSICDLLLHCTRSIEQFDAAFQRMHGFNRVETNFSVSESSRLALSARLLARAALTGVPPGANGGKSNDNEIIRWAGTLPSSADPIYVLTRCSASSGQGTLVVCCEHALVANAVMNVLKRAISE